VGTGGSTTEGTGGAGGSVVGTGGAGGVGGSTTEGTGGAGGAGGAGGSTTEGTGGAAACLGVTPTGTIPACAGNACDDGTGSKFDACPTLEGDVTEGVRESIVNCLNGLGATCTTAQQGTCISDALAQACADSNATQTCTDIETACKGTITDCESYLNGLTAKARTNTVNCINAANVTSCTDELSKAA
jgi:hypothetical protein